MYKSKKIFCKNKHGYIFLCSKFLKQYININGNFQYIAMIKPISSTGIQFSYIIMNEDWEIDSMSERLYSLFGKKHFILIKT